MDNERTINDFYLMPWEQYQEAVEYLSTNISEFIKQNEISFDFIVPILRGGGVLSISLSHSLNIFRIFPVQYKYMHLGGSDDEYKPYEWLFSLNQLEDKFQEYNILVTEGNHCTGQTSQMCINKIKELLPNSKIYYASVGRDYSYTQKMNYTIYEWWGVLTNESESLAQKQCDELSVINKFIVYPWENVYEELEEVNASMIYHNNQTE
ncbi:MAG: hypothetical protein IJN56_04290 [Clostridia bacterium]|nr:hypothetical protein [Clostridia bacterium]